MTTPIDHPFTLRPAEMTPAERATAVAAILAAGLLRLLRFLRPEHYLAPADRANSQKITGESAC